MTADWTTQADQDVFRFGFWSAVATTPVIPDGDTYVLRDLTGLPDPGNSVGMSTVFRYPTGQSFTINTYPAYPVNQPFFPAQPPEGDGGEAWIPRHARPGLWQANLQIEGVAGAGLDHLEVNLLDQGFVDIFPGTPTRLQGVVIQTLMVTNPGVATPYVAQIRPVGGTFQPNGRELQMTFLAALPFQEDIG
jgi:hypothetical protein